jgi:hypothetical protein
VPWGFVAMLAMVWIIESIVVRCEGHWKPMLAWDWRTTSAAASRSAADCDVLCFGDSQVKHGVLPGVIEERTGWRAYNLALNRGQAPASYYLLRRALRSGARPKAIVVGFHSGLLTTFPAFNWGLWPELLEPGELCGLIWEARDVTLATRTLIGWLLPSTRQSQEIRAAVGAALVGQPLDPRGLIPAARRNWLAHRGAQANEKDPSFTDPPVRPAVPWEGCYWTCRRANRIYLRSFLQLAASRDVPVYLLLPTRSPSARFDRERRGTDAMFDRFLKGLQTEFPNLYVVDGRRLNYDKTLFIDTVHLDRDGAAAFTREVASVLQRKAPKTGAEPRWTVLSGGDVSPTSPARPPRIVLHCKESSER